MEGCYSFISIVLIVIHLGYQTSVSKAFTEPCNASQKTITTVLKCPANLSSFEAAAKRKNCSSLAGEARNCKSFQYHCVLSKDLKSVIELCAPSINIIDHVCTTFSSYYKSIIRVHELTCSECPWSYNSTNAYQYQQCYSYMYTNQPLTTEITISTLQANRSASQAKKESKDPNGNIHVIFAVTAVIIVIVVIIAVYRHRRIGKMKNEPNRYEMEYQEPANIEQNEPNQGLAHMESGSAEGQSSSDEDGHLTEAFLMSEVQHLNRT